MGRVLNSEVLAGFLVIALGCLALLAVGNLEIGAVNDMGPGYMPRVVALAIILFGLAMTVWAFLREHPSIPVLYWRPMAAISAATIAFGLAIDRLGMVVAVVVMTVIARLANSTSRYKEIPILAAALAACAVVVFILGLKLAIPIWPR